jgi:prepilin signal peptidase PulO-like enzyme (type II secretory pathway)
MTDHLLRNATVIELFIVLDRGFKFFGVGKSGLFQHLFDPAIESLDHAIGLRMAWLGESMLDVVLVAGSIEQMLSCRRPLGVAGLASSHAGFTPHSLIASAASAAAVLGLFGGLGLVFRRVRGKSGMGGGDLKLLAALATWRGVVDVLYVVSLASLGTVVWNLAWRQFKGLGSDAEWPFGPANVAAALLWGV